MQSPLNVHEKALKFLFENASSSDSGICPPELTQQRIADNLGISRPYAAKQLKRLKEVGYVDSCLVRVAGMSRKVHVYRLTPLGRRRVGKPSEPSDRIVLRDVPGNGGGMDLMGKLVEIVSRSKIGGI